MSTTDSTGLPTANNTHQLAQDIAPESKIVYVDNDPLVLVHARALLTSHPDGTTNYIDADIRDPEKILHAAADDLDFTQPIAVMMIGILGHVADSDNPAAIVRRIVDALPSGSYLVINDSITTPVPLVGTYDTEDDSPFDDIDTGLPWPPHAIADGSVRIDESHDHLEELASGDYALEDDSLAEQELDAFIEGKKRPHHLSD